jgi:hypothetical protein
MSRSRPRVETTQAPSHQSPKGAVFFFVWYIVGLLIFHTLANFDEGPAWSAVYFLWQHVKDVLAVWIIARLSGYWKIFYPVVIYSIVRLCIEIIIIATGESPNIGAAVVVLYLLALCAVLFLTFIQMRKEWKQKSTSGS